ncbi:MAG: recombinase family protein [Chloroflexi bacterium]|nr:recombinase family protein [Chloroflexota bacterium]
MHNTKKRAVIYVRVSSETQGEKASPDEQEADCRKCASEHDLIVVAVYRDTEKYRVKGKLVEPSGERADRPALQRMIRDGREGHFDGILAWKEDRLYRGLKAMFVVLEFMKEYKIEGYIVRETFDAKMSPLKAWMAGMELEAIKERMTMGVKARLRAGKANTGQDRYGYKRYGDVIRIVEEEAKWVREIFKWYTEKVPLQEIRRRLIAAAAPQKGCSRPRKIDWAISTIQAILKSAEKYASGIKIQSREGEEFEIPVEPIIDQITLQKILEVRAANKRHPVHNVKHCYLAGGKIFCACKRKWGARTNSYTRKSRRGDKVARHSLHGTYYCPQQHKEYRHPNCPKTIGHKKADIYVWAKVCEVLNTPEILMAGARVQVNQIIESAQSAENQASSLSKKLEKTLSDRKWVIAKAREGAITDQDMQEQLELIKAQEMEIKREISLSQQIIDLNALKNWEAQAQEYLSDLRLGLDWLNTEPENDDAGLQKFNLKRRMIDVLVDHIEITKGQNKERNMNIIFRLNLLEILKQSSDFSYLKEVGTYSHTPTSHARRLGEVCA